MEEKSKTDKRRESAHKEFSGVVDATSEFLKKVFPHTYSLIDKLRGVKKEQPKKDE